jgi:hypothetical protein
VSAVQLGAVPTKPKVKACRESALRCRDARAFRNAFAAEALGACAWPLGRYDRRHNRFQSFPTRLYRYRFGQRFLLPPSAQLRPGLHSRRQTALHRQRQLQAGSSVGRQQSPLEGSGTLRWGFPHPPGRIGPFPAIQGQAHQIARSCDVLERRCLPTRAHHVQQVPELHGDARRSTSREGRVAVLYATRPIGRA